MNQIEKALAWSTAAGSVAKGVLFSVGALFFTRVVGLSPATVGAGLTIAGAAGMAAAFAAGNLSDRYGARRILLSATLAQAVALAAYCSTRHPVAFVLVACAAAGGQGAQRTAQVTLIARAFEGPGRIRARARLRVVSNVFVAVGSALAAGALALGTTTAYEMAMLAASALMLSSALPLRALPPDAAPPADMLVAAAPAAVLARGEPDAVPSGVPVAVGARGGDGSLGLGRSPLRDRRYLALAAFNGVVTVQFGLLTVGMPLWVTGHTRAPAATVALLLLFNTGLVTLGQIRFTRTVVGVSSAGRAVLRATLLLLGACLLYATAAHGDALVAVGVLLLAVVAHSLGEMLSEAGGWELAFELADPRNVGAYQGVSQTGFAIGTALAPAAVTSTAITHGTAGWLLLGGAFLAAGAGTALITTAAARRGGAGHA